DEQQHDDGDERRAQGPLRRRLVAAEQRDHDQHEADGERHIGDRGETLPPEMLGPGLGRAKPAHARERGAKPDLAHRWSPNTRYPTTQRTSVSTIDPTSVMTASQSRSLGENPRPVSQIRWRMPPSM